MGTGIKQIERHYGHVATESLIEEATKDSTRKNREESGDLREAAGLVRLLEREMLQLSKSPQKLSLLVKRERLNLTWQSKTMKKCHKKLVQ
jgi:hypothetical protein